MTDFKKITIHFSADDLAEISKVESALYPGIFASFPKTLKFCVTFVKSIMEMPGFVVPELPAEKLNVWLSSIQKKVKEKEKATLLKEMDKKTDLVIP